MTSLIRKARRRVHTITVDNGTEFHSYKDVEKATSQSAKAWLTSLNVTAIASPAVSTTVPGNDSAFSHQRSAMNAQLSERCCTSNSMSRDVAYHRR